MQDASPKSPVYVGIDVAKRSFDVAVLPDQQRASLSYDPAGMQQLLDLLRPLGVCLVVLEATGGLERALAAELIDAGHQVAIVNPRQVRDFARGSGQLAKTDRLDALVLARFAQQVQPRLTEKTPEKHAELAALVSRRRQLQAMAVAEANRRGVTHAGQARHSVDKLLSWLRREISALVGLAPYNHDSGRLRGKRSIWGGRINVRSALYMAALTAQRCNPIIRTFAERLKQAGKPFKVVLTACMRKLLTILNVLAKNQQHWSPNAIQSS